MTDILSLVFRTFTSHSEAEKDLAACSPLPATACSALLVGDRSVSRSVLLLAAVTAASQLGIRVMFYTRTQIQSLPPSLQKCVPNPETLKKIKFSYPRTAQELLQQVASLHEPTNTFPTPPSLIIVDRLEDFLSDPAGGSETESHPRAHSRAAHLSALLCDTASFLTQTLQQRSSSSGPCRVIVSVRSEVDTGQASGGPSATDPLLDILDRYYQVRCTLDQDRTYEAAAAGLQQMWHIYLSGRGIAEASCTKDCEEGPSLAQEWQLRIFPNGVMEFQMV